MTPDMLNARLATATIVLDPKAAVKMKPTLAIKEQMNRCRRLSRLLSELRPIITINTIAKQLGIAVISPMFSGLSTPVFLTICVDRKMGHPWRCNHRYILTISKPNQNCFCKLEIN
jgi:hypothetical protein